MKSYNQLKEDTYSVFLKEWEKLDEDTQQEFIRQFAEEYNLDEEAFTAAATSPAWLPWAATAIGGIGTYLQMRNRNKSNNPSSTIYKSTVTGDIDKENEKLNKQSSKNSGTTLNTGQTQINPPGNNKNNKNNKNNGKLKKAVTAGVVGTGVVSGVNTLSGNKDKSTETNYTNQLKKKNNNGSSSSSGNTTKSPLKFEL